MDYSRARVRLFHRFVFVIKHLFEDTVMVFMVRTGDHWHTRRKQLTPSFHFKILETYLPIFNNNAKALIEDLAETRGRPIDVHSVISSCTLDIICGQFTGN